jgi:hypothetical protein
MSWGELPGRLQRFSSTLRREKETRPTADFLDGQAARFIAQWNSERKVAASLVPLPHPRGQGLHPRGCEIHGCYLSFRYMAGDDEANARLADFQVRVDGLVVAGDSLVELQDHWRIDTESGDTERRREQGDLEKTEGREPHPSFHFQRGGHAQDAFAALDGFVPSAHTALGKGIWRGLMQYPGPRIPSLPFDPLLALDFCIAQNNGPLWRKLRAVPEYFSTIEESQKRLWRPFFESLSERNARRTWLGSVVIV